MNKPLEDTSQACSIFSFTHWQSPESNFRRNLWAILSEVPLDNPSVPKTL